MNKSIEPTDGQIIIDKNRLSKLIRMKRALNDWTNQQLRDEYLNKSPYSFGITDDSAISRLVTQSATSSLNSKDKLKLKRMMEEIELEIKLDLEGYEGFAGKPYKVNSNTVNDWMSAAEEAKRCIFFNTYIKMKDWHNPIIQMHMCLQKSIEQKSNLVNVLACHNLKGNNHKDKIEKNRASVIHACTNKQPLYKHFRIIFLPLTTKEFNEEYEKRESFYDNLRFSTFQHSALSIQLALLTADDLMNFMNHVDHTVFFQKEDNLKVLGLDKKFAAQIKNKEFTKDKVQSLVDCLIEMRNIPERKSEIGMDYMLIEREDGTTTNKDLWTAFLTTKTGLNYANCEEKDNIKVRRAFTQKIFNYVTTEAMPSDHPPGFSDVDPLFDYNKDIKQRIVKNVFHPIHRR